MTSPPSTEPAHAWITAGAAAGLRRIQRDDPGAIVPPQARERFLDRSVLADRIRHLNVTLNDMARLDALQRTVWPKRMHFIVDDPGEWLDKFFQGVTA